MAGERWEVGSRITHEDELASAPVGIGTNSFAVLPEAEEMASVAGVDESGIIFSWFMRHAPVEEALDFLREKGQYELMVLTITSMEEEAALKAWMDEGESNG